MKQLDYIIAYLRQKKNQAFDGSIKIGIERGKIVSIGEANLFDIPTSDNVKADTEDRLLSAAMDPEFNGTIVFVMKFGVTERFGYTRTFKGEDLRRLLEA